MNSGSVLFRAHSHSFRMFGFALDEYAQAGAPTPIALLCALARRCDAAAARRTPGSRHSVRGGALNGDSAGGIFCVIGPMLGNDQGCLLASLPNPIA